MSYAIIRNANYKVKNLSGLYRHNERKNTNYSNNEIKKENFANNYSFKMPTSTYEKEFISLKEKYNLKGQIKQVSNVVCEFIITSDKHFFEDIGQEETRRYFKTAYDFVANYKSLGEKYILSAKVHMDETTPHMHMVFIPVVHTKDENGNKIDKIACSEFWKEKHSYRHLQDNFYSYITKAGFNLQRGNSKDNIHIPIETLKDITEYNNIKFEMEKTPIKDLVTSDMQLIVAQNKKLVKYCNTLRGYYIKSIRAIEKYGQLQQENTDLKHENTNLKDKNHKLSNYIYKVFEIIINVFQIPKGKIIKEIKNHMI